MTRFAESSASSAKQGAISPWLAKMATSGCGPIARLAEEPRCSCIRTELAIGAATFGNTDDCSSCVCLVSECCRVAAAPPPTPNSATSNTSRWVSRARTPHLTLGVAASVTARLKLGTADDAARSTHAQQLRFPRRFAQAVDSP